MEEKETKNEWAIKWWVLYANVIYNICIIGQEWATLLGKCAAQFHIKLTKHWFGSPRHHVALHFEKRYLEICSFFFYVSILPVQSSSILPNCALRQSFTHNSMSCRDKLSDVTFVEYTFTAIVWPFFWNAVQFLDTLANATYSLFTLNQHLKKETIENEHKWLKLCICIALQWFRENLKETLVRHIAMCMCACACVCVFSVRVVVFKGTPLAEFIFRWHLNNYATFRCSTPESDSLHVMFRLCQTLHNLIHSQLEPYRNVRSYLHLHILGVCVHSKYTSQW